MVTVQANGGRLSIAAGDRRCKRAMPLVHCIKSQPCDQRSPCGYLMFGRSNVEPRIRHKVTRLTSLRKFCAVPYCRASCRDRRRSCTGTRGAARGSGSGARRSRSALDLIEERRVGQSLARRAEVGADVEEELVAPDPHRLGAEDRRIAPAVGVGRHHPPGRASAAEGSTRKRECA